MAVMDPDPVPIIFTVTFHGIICEVTLSNLIVRIYHNLERSENKSKYYIQSTEYMFLVTGDNDLHPFSDLKDIISWFDISNIDPLAINVMAIQIPASHCDALLTKVSTLISLGNT